jgi:phosphohistidine phosphatase SixA
MRLAILAALALCAATSVVAGADPDPDKGTPITGFVGRMDVLMPEGGHTVPIDDSLIFEPLQMLDELFTRDDVVLLMRHGPTDWSQRDIKNVAPDDCANQRALSEDGHRRMEQMGALIATNDIMPSRVVVSQWCRNQQTVAGLMTGFEAGMPGSTKGLDVVTDPSANLLLSLQGAPNVTGLRQLISDWNGLPERKGPLLLVTHFTNIEELTEFKLYEGEILIVDPKRENRVLGYLRLRSAGPDVGHFSTE